MFFQRKNRRKPRSCLGCKVFFSPLRPFVHLAAVSFWLRPNVGLGASESLASFARCIRNGGEEGKRDVVMEKRNRAANFVSASAWWQRKRGESFWGPGWVKIHPPSSCFFFDLEKGGRGGMFTVGFPQSAEGEKESCKTQNKMRRKWEGLGWCTSKLSIFTKSKAQYFSRYCMIWRTCKWSLGNGRLQRWLWALARWRMEPTNHPFLAVARCLVLVFFYAGAAASSSCIRKTGSWCTSPFHKNRRKSSYFLSLLV